MKNKNVAAALTVPAVIIALSLINAFVRLLPQEYTVFDMTDDGLYSLSEHTEQLISSLNEDVTINLIFTEGEEDQTMERLVGVFTGKNSCIHYIKRPTEKYPDFVSQYTDRKLEDNSWIVVSGDRSYVIPYSDIYVSDYEKYFETGEITTEFCGERCLAAAIRYVSSAELPRLAMLTGHGEKAAGSIWESAFESAGFALEELDLFSAGEIDGEISCILIFSPQTDFSDKEIAAVESYLKNGGRLLYITDFVSDALSKLHSYTEKYCGVSFTEGIVLEGDKNHCMSGYNFNLIPDIQTHDLTVALKQSGLRIVMPAAQGLRIDEDGHDRVYTKPLLLSSNKAYIKNPFTMETLLYEQGDEKGCFALAAAVKDMNTNSRIVIISSASLLEKEADSWSNGGNEQLVSDSLNWLAGKEKNISIQAKVMSSQYLSISASDASILSVLFIGAIPCAFVVVGIITVYRRKKK